MRPAHEVLDELERHYETRIVDDGGGYTDNMSEFGPGAVKVITADRAALVEEMCELVRRRELYYRESATYDSIRGSAADLRFANELERIADAIRSKFGAPK